MRREILTREEFYDLFQGPSNDKKRSNSSQLSFNVGGNDPAIEVMWSEDRQVKSMPSLCVVKKENLRDFLAWAATYLPSASPLTAFCRVITPEVFDALPKSGSGRQTTRILDGGVIGVIFAEALSYFDGKEDSGNLSAAACVRTYSHAMARAVSLGYPWPLVQRAGAAWHELREFTGQTNTAIAPEELQTCWSVVYSMFAEDQGREVNLGKDLRIICAACRDIAHQSEISPATWSDLTYDLRSLSDLHSLMTGPREERVLILEQVLSALPAVSVIADHKLSFAVAYLASRISPGTLDHFGLLRSKIAMNSLAGLWYGLCSGLSSHRDLRDSSSGLSLRLLRDLLRPCSLEESPHCDLSIDELKVLMSGSAGEISVKPGRPGILEVELLPLVNSTIRWPGSRLGSSGELFNSTMMKDVSRLTEELAQLTKRADYIVYSLSKYFPPSSRPEDPAKRSRRKRNAKDY